MPDTKPPTFLAETAATERRQRSGLGRSGVVVYGWRPDCPNAAVDLATDLLAELGKIGPNHGFGPVHGPIAIGKGRLNEPLLTVSGQPGPGFSLSRCLGLLYGAVAGQGRVGCDCAVAAEFREPYPFQRVFTEQELTQAIALCGSVGSGAALLWTLKEAAVKAMGTGFHLIDPIEVRIESFIPSGAGYEGRITARQSLSSWSEPVRDGWLSLAVTP